MYHKGFYCLAMLHASLPTSLQWKSDSERTSLQRGQALLQGGVAKSAGHGCRHLLLKLSLPELKDTFAALG